MLAVKNIFKQEIMMLQLTFNPGLTITGFLTTQPWCTLLHCKLAIFILDFRLSLPNKYERVKNYSNYDFVQNDKNDGSTGKSQCGILMYVGLTFTFIELIVSITKFSIVIGSPRAYLSRNRRAITWVSDYRCPAGVRFELFQIGHL